jgi:acetyltransferase-like isoleucine patch superfamily enzyme
MIRDTFGRGWLLYAIARIQKRFRLSAIKRSAIDSTAAVQGGSQVVDSEIGRHSFCGYDCVILNASIGSFCSIADRVTIGGSGHPTHFVSTSPFFLSHRDAVKTKFSRHDYYDVPRTEIGHDVWIGFGAMIKSGVKIGHGSVVGMGSVVTKDVQPYSIVAGNPARELSRRFTEQVVDALIRSQWWHFDDPRLRSVAKYFNSPEHFLRNEGLL